MYEEIKKLLVDELSVDEKLISPEAQLATDLGINSLELADLALLCEERYKVSIKEEDMNKFLTVNDIVSYLSTQNA